MREGKYSQEAGIGKEVWPRADPLARAGGEGARDREPVMALRRDAPKLAASFPGKAHSFSAKGGRDVWP